MKGLNRIQSRSAVPYMARVPKGFTAASGSGEVNVSLEVERVGDRSRFHALEMEWRDLVADSTANEIFLTWEWLHTWWECLAGNRRLLLLVVRQGQRLVGIAPLCIAPASLSRGLPFRRIEFLGSGIVGSDYLDLIARRGFERAVAEAVAGHLRGLRCVLMFSGVESGSETMRHMTSSLAQGGWSVYRTATERCPYVDTTGVNWGEYQRSLGKMHRETGRRKRRRANDKYAIRYRQVDTEESRQEVFPEWIALHTRRWELAGGTQAVPDDAVRAFHDRLTAMALERGWLRLSVLEFDGLPAASVYGFIYSGKYYFYQTGYDPAFGRFSPGIMCLEHSLENALEEGVSEFDFLHGTEGYKFIYARQMRDLVRYTCTPPGVSGAGFRGVLGARRAARRVLGRADAAREEQVLVSTGSGDLCQ